MVERFAHLEPSDVFIISFFFPEDQAKVLCRLYQKEDWGCQSYSNHSPSVTLIILFIYMFASFSFVDKQNRSLVILVVIITLTLTSSKNDQLIPFHQWSFVWIESIYVKYFFEFKTIEFLYRFVMSVNKGCSNYNKILVSIVLTYSTINFHIFNYYHITIYLFL